MKQQFAIASAGRTASTSLHDTLVSTLPVRNSVYPIWDLSPANLLVADFPYHLGLLGLEHPRRMDRTGVGYDTKIVLNLPEVLDWAVGPAEDGLRVSSLQPV